MKDSKNISDAFLFIRNGKSVKQSNESSGVPITRIETIADKSIDINKLGYANIEIDNLGGFENYLLEEGDILMSHINSPKHLGKTAVYENVPDRLIHGMNLLCLRTNKTICDFKYANYFFQSNFFLQDLAKISNKSVNQASFSVGKLKELKIPLPPLKTQQRIAQILDDAAALRDKTNQLLTEYDLLAQSIFLEMFGDPGNNPKGWPVKSFGDVGKLDRGKSKHRPRNAPELLGGDYPLIQTGDIANCDGYIRDFRSTYSEVGLAQSKMWPKGTLCITIAANIANTGILNFDACFPDSVVGFIPNEHTNNEFTQYWMSFLQSVIEANAPQAAQKNINLKILRELEFFCPPIILQNQFAEKIALIEQQKALAKQELQESEDLFNCLLQKAFKGELI